MAKLDDNNKKVKFSSISENVLPLTRKITAVKYKTDSEGNITFNKPIINAIDIDWNNATTDEITEPIQTTADLIKVISDNKKNINNIKIPKYVDDLVDGYNVIRLDMLESITNNLKGASAFDIAKQAAIDSGLPFPYQTEAEWISSLKGEKGATGDSAYAIAKRTALLSGSDFPYNNEGEWINSITNATVAKQYTDEKINEIKVQLSTLNNLKAGNGITIDENNNINATANTWINL